MECAVTPPPPPWIWNPNIRRYSIGWRMGPGEDAYFEFYQWFSALTDEEATSFEIEHPEPSEWQGFYLKVRQNPWK